jgi:hypothetical protein
MSRYQVGDEVTLKDAVEMKVIYGDDLQNRGSLQAGICMTPEKYNLLGKRVIIVSVEKRGGVDAYGVSTMNGGVESSGNTFFEDCFRIAKPFDEILKKGYKL